MWVEAPDNTLHYGTVIFNPFGKPIKGTVLTPVKKATMTKTLALKDAVKTQQAIEAEERHRLRR